MSTPHMRCRPGTRDGPGCPAAVASIGRGRSPATSRAAHLAAVVDDRSLVDRQKVDPGSRAVISAWRGLACRRAATVDRRQRAHPRSRSFRTAPPRSRDTSGRYRCGMSLSNVGRGRIALAHRVSPLSWALTSRHEYHGGGRCGSDTSRKSARMAAMSCSTERLADVTSRPASPDPHVSSPAVTVIGKRARLRGRALPIGDVVATRARRRTVRPEGKFRAHGPDSGSCCVITAFAAMRTVFDRADSRYGDNVWRSTTSAGQRLVLAYASRRPRSPLEPCDQPEEFLYPGIVTGDDGIVLWRPDDQDVPAIADWLFLSSIHSSSQATGIRDVRVDLRAGTAPLSAAVRAALPRARSTTHCRPDPSRTAWWSRDVSCPGRTSRQSRHPARERPVLRDGRARLRQLPAARPVRRPDGFASGLASAGRCPASPPVQAQLGGEIAAFCAALTRSSRGQATTRGVLTPSPSSSTPG